jgi:histidinol dehydrogenase
MPGGTLSAGRLDEDDIAAIDAGIGVALNNDIVTARQVANDVDLDGRAGVVDVVVVADAEAEAEAAAGYCIEIRVG